MSNIIIPKRSTVAGKVPLTTDLQIGEIAINLADCLLYSKDASGVVVQIGGGGGLPSQAGNGGYFLTTDGSSAFWQEIGEFSDGVFALTDDADATKKAVFQVSGVTTGTTVTLTVPNISATLAHLGNASQTFLGTTQFSGAAGFFGMSTANSSSTLGGGATLSGNTKTINVGTAGASGSTTNVNIGSAVSGATTNVTINATGFNFASASARITGDFSNATLASRLMFQTNTVNGVTSVIAIPNGTGGAAAWTVANGPDVANASTAQIYIGAGEMQLRSSKNGTGSYLPMTFYTNNVLAATIDTSQNLTVVGNVTGNSDETLKTNWRPLQRNFVEMLANVRHGIYDRLDIDATQVGVSAQSLQWVLEHAVTRGADGKLSVAYGNAALVSAIALAERVVQLEQRLAKLEN